MEKTTGQLKLLSDSRIFPSAKRYSFIEIGDKRLRNVVVRDGFSTILEEGLNGSSPITIWSTTFLGTTQVQAISRSNGKVYRRGGIAKLIVGIPILLWGILMIAISPFPVVGLACLLAGGWMTSSAVHLMRIPNSEKL